MDLMMGDFGDLMFDTTSTDHLMGTPNLALVEEEAMQQQGNKQKSNNSKKKKVAKKKEDVVETACMKRSRLHRAKRKRELRDLQEENIVIKQERNKLFRVSFELQRMVDDMESCVDLEMENQLLRQQLADHKLFISHFEQILKPMMSDSRQFNIDPAVYDLMFETEWKKAKIPMLGMCMLGMLPKGFQVDVFYDDTKNSRDRRCRIDCTVPNVHADHVFNFFFNKFLQTTTQHSMFEIDDYKLTSVDTNDDSKFVYLSNLDNGQDDPNDLILKCDRMDIKLEQDSLRPTTSTTDESTINAKLLTMLAPHKRKADFDAIVQSTLIVESANSSKFMFHISFTEDTEYRMLKAMDLVVRDGTVTPQTLGIIPKIPTLFAMDASSSPRIIPT